MSTARKTIESSPIADANRSRKVAIALAFAGALPVPLPIAWIHKFYLGQYLWGIVYLVLAPTGLPQVACCLEGLWYVSQNDEDFSAKFPAASETLSAVTVLAQSSNAQVQTIQKALKIQPSTESNSVDSTSVNLAAVIRELDQLRKEGLITEYEFEQKRRKLLDQIT
ncbi:MAG: hypothetical protein DCF25_01805 [Leptolyngbya foveolarum]|uniref:SHOCT domain-containing protein n=1 Tax=Leptolyngbya foveolarum TaxID=47253 RepID=A0A2W4UQY4_9CYAN|nr:MAG: hypothetical protein DCF25_01805 [Leptolyngbya foveolarum]